MTNPSTRLTLAAIGCGGRTRTYCELAMRQPERYRVVAAADPNPIRLEWTAHLSKNPEFRAYRDAVAILSEPKLADIMIIGTQDADHREHAIASMEKGYDLLLEKPIATNLEDTLAVQQTAQKLGRRVLVCHVLRYTPFYRKVKEIIDSGVLGKILSLNATEGVGAWHQCHSYVRGHWSNTQTTSPMILAKSCHDLDIIRWFIGSPCRQISSFGSLNYFTQASAPAGAPKRCFDGCPVENTCPYHAKRYLEDQSKWLSYVCELDMNSEKSVLRAWLHQSKWGRCVYHCDNDAVDHQTVNLAFENNATATFTMTAFEGGRHLELFGTEGRLRGGDFVRQSCGYDISVRFHKDESKEHTYTIHEQEGGYDGHMGGDAGIMNQLYDEMLKPSKEDMVTSLDISVESHVMAFAAERSRLNGKSVLL